MSVRSSAIGLAVVIVLMGAGAAQSLTGSNTVFGDDIVDGTITHADVKANSLGGSRLLDNAVTSGKIFDGTVTGADVGDNSVKGADVDESTLQIPLVWQPLPFINGAQLEFTGARFAKDAHGVVHLSGSARLGSGPSAGTFAQLPVGFRPSRQDTYANACVIAGESFGVTTVIVNTDGTVVVFGSSSCPLDSLDDVRTGIFLGGTTFPTN